MTTIEAPGAHSRAGRSSVLLLAAAGILFLVAGRMLPTSAPPGSIAGSSDPVSDAASAVPQAPPPPARAPAHLGWRRWKQVLWRTYLRSDNNRLLATAAGVVFFGLLAIFPAITALVSCYALFATPSTIAGSLQTLAMMLPPDSFQIIQDQIARVLAKGDTTLGATFLFGLGLAIWSANAGVKAVFDALNVAYEEPEKRGFLRLNLLALAFTIGGIVAMLVMVGAVVALPLALDHLRLMAQSRVLLTLARWPLLFVVLMVALGILYRFGPSRTAPRWQWLSAGAVTAALLWMAGSALLSWYLSRFADYDATYGSLGAAIGLMMWMWMSAIVILYGAELNSEIERQTASLAPVGPAGPSVAPDVAKEH